MQNDSRRGWSLPALTFFFLTLILSGCGGGSGTVSGIPDSSGISCNNGSDTYTPLASPVITIAAAARISFAIKDDGTLWAWGNNTKGQLGAGATTNSVTPLQIGLGNTFKAISAGFGHSLALKKDGTLWAWGDNSFGQLGNNSTASSSVPIQIGSDNDTYTAISAGLNFSLAVKSNGTLWAWGDNSFGQLGIGDDNTKLSTVPIQVGTDNDYTAISAGTAHALALKANHSLWAWGDNTYGELGDGCYIDGINKQTVCAIRNDKTINSNIPELIDSGIPYGAIAAGYFYSLAIKDDGTLMAWGNNSHSDLGTGSSTATYIVPTKIGEGFKPDADALSASKFSVLGNTTVYYHSLALKSDGSLWAWGDNIFGELGDGSRTPSSAPKQILASSGFAFTAVSAGDDDHSLAIKNDGSLWAWGFNSCGQLGDGTTTDSEIPIQVSR